MSALPVQVLKKLSATLQQANLISSALGSEINRLRLINDKNAKDYLHIDIKEFSKREAAVYRSSHKQNISIEMLQEGYHKSFSEIFNLIEKRKCLREAGGPGSDIWLETPLEEQHDKLDQLQYFLTRAEAAQRTGRYEEVYRNQLSLAQFFKNSGDGWLSDHFFECCFNSAKHIKLDGGKKEAESHANLGLVREKHGQLEKAAEHYETFHHLTVGRIWKDETGRTQHTVACENLWRIYTLLADKMLENKEHKQAIRSLIKAFEMAKEGGDNKIKGESAYRLGLAYLSTGNPQSAISSLNTYMEISRKLQDNIGIGKANEALAKALESQGKITDCVQYLEKFIEIAKSGEMSQSLVESCICLGDIFNTRGRYSEACKYFKKAYKTVYSLDNLPLMEEAQVYYGIGQAHNMMMAFSNHTEAGDNVNIRSLLDWKESRTDM
ncbi:tetratricopeptide repeat protein 29 isoform X1 [Rhinatrema bivittatum]|uniref:tetratricopeptide repeat protein 29 isoform X1 n=1 Tax=Rhinatrema bivittatum TaxID=194408 RepID=UPI00112C392F|nr:tetratricopeptide repeat protein 29 isoform X1 [Rhinatrema bivittatum]XP_029459033.1 tetratricopeptide repeat protein 29 isoform X1 [Rhinatrema bivittatum]